MYSVRARLVNILIKCLAIVLLFVFTFFNILAILCTHKESTEITPELLNIDVVNTAEINTVERASEDTQQVDLSNFYLRIDYISREFNIKDKINLSDSEREMLAKLIYLEAGDQSIECQKAVASVVINRLNKGTWGDSIEEVIYAPHQFSPAKKISRIVTRETQLEIVDEICKNGVSIPNNVIYFRDWYFHKFEGAKPYKNFGSMYFSFG